MAIQVQIVIMDSKDYVLEFKDFKPTDTSGITNYIFKHMTNPAANKIHIRKWNY